MDDYDVKWKDHSHVAVSLVAGFQRRDRFADISLVCGNRTIAAHRVILAACSAYVDRLLDRLGAEHGRTAIVLKDVKPEVMQLAVEFMYSGQVLVPSDKLNDFMDLAKSLEIRGLGAFQKIVEETNSKSPPKRKTKEAAKSKNKQASDEDDDDDEWNNCDGEEDDDGFDAPRSKRAKATPGGRKASARVAAAAVTGKRGAVGKKSSAPDDDWSPPSASRSTRRSGPPPPAPPPPSAAGRGRPRKGGAVKEDPLPPPQPPQPAPAPVKEIKVTKTAVKTEVPAIVPESPQVVHVAHVSQPMDHANVGMDIIVQDEAHIGGDTELLGTEDDNVEFDTAGDYPIDELPQNIPAELSTTEELQRMSKYIWRATDMEGKNAFFCALCGFVAMRKMDANVHERKHTGVKAAFACDECGRNFTLKCNLYAHQRNVHGITAIPVDTAVATQTVGIVTEPHHMHPHQHQHQHSHQMASVVGSVGSVVVTTAPDTLAEGPIVI